MSRICVKGLPRYATEAQLREHFARVGTVTDVKIARTKDGKSRQFAFIGFSEPARESAAVSRYNKSFMDTARLVVEAAKPIGDESVLQTAKSRHTAKKQATASDKASGKAAGTHAHPRTHTHTHADALESAMSGVKDKDKLAEFLGVMASDRNAHTWANDDEMRTAVLAPAAQAKLASRRARAGTEESVDGKVVGRSGKAGSDRGAADAGESGGDDAADGEAVLPRKKKEVCGPKPAGMSDLEYLRSRTTGAFSDSEDDEAKDETDAKKEGAAETASTTASSDSEDTRAKAVRPGKRPRAASAGSAASAGGKPQTSSTAAVVPDTVDAGETGRVFVRNLPYSVTEDSLRAHFLPYGRIADLRLPIDSTGKPKGFAYITYIIPEHAVLAMAGTDGKVFQGRLLHVLPAKPAREDEVPAAGAEGATASSSFKRSREAERKAAAGTQAEERSVWSVLFVRADATVGALAERLGVARSDVLDRDADSMAVRMALAETQVIAETKAFLKDEGIDIDAMEAALHEAVKSGRAIAGTPLKRSNLVILVKNLPHTADSEKLRDMFSRHGTILRFVMPPSRALALIEFADAKSAKRAFSTLAYARYERVPLYLEWAPEKVFVKAAPAASAPPADAPAASAAPKAKAAAPAAADAKSKAKSNAKDATAASNTATEDTATAGTKRRRSDSQNDASAPAASATATPSVTAPAEIPEAAAADALPTDGHTVYVKNVSFDSTEEGLRDMFASVGSVRSVKIPKRRNPKYRADATGPSAHPQWLSMGYAFVEYVNAEDAKKALKSLQGRELDGHALSLKISTTPDAAAAAPTGKATKKAKSTTPEVDASNATKLLVRNLAFEATKKDIQQLFGAFGAVKTIRIPKKFDGSHRGFAFVEFLTHAEAEAAKAALASTHLYGRHLVLEWAATEDAAASGAAPK